jgi:hypothetical protein
VREHPEIGVRVDSSHSYRQFLVDGFPYKIVYRERTDDLYIVAYAAHISDNTSACSRTVCVAFSCMSGG